MIFIGLTSGLVVVYLAGSALMEHTTSIYAPIGRIDSSNAAAAEAEMLTKIKEGSPLLIIDLQRLDYLSSAGLRVLLLAAKTCRAGGGKAVIQQAAPAVRDVLKMSGFDKIIPMLDSRDDALAALSA
jgi:stage II sporulation protein AA (anti-sigma F factor antagonist)